MVEYEGERWAAVVVKKAQDNTYHVKYADDFSYEKKVKASRVAALPPVSILIVNFKFIPAATISQSSPLSSLLRRHHGTRLLIADGVY